MSTQLIEEEIVFEVTVQEDDTTVHLMSPTELQWVRLNQWFGSMKLVNQIAVNTFNSCEGATLDSVIGRAVTSFAPSLSKLPSSSIGNKINELSQWVSEGNCDAEEDDDQRIIVSGHDFNVKPEGAVWIAGLGDTPVVLTAAQMLREPISVELLANPMNDLDTVAMVINYRHEVSTERHLTVV